MVRASQWIFGVSTSSLIAACSVVAPLDAVSSGSNDGNAGPCSTNVECSERNAEEPYLCTASRKCAPLKSEECRFVYDGKSGQDYLNQNAIFLGAFANYGATLGQSIDILNYRLALSELSGTNVGGLPGPNNQLRPLVLIVCDNADGNNEQSAIVERGLKHLVDDLHVPGILAALREEDLLLHFGTYGFQKGTFFLSPFGANRRLADFRDDGLLWHMLGLPEQLAPGYVKLLEKLEARVRAQNGNLPIKVAVISGTDGFHSELRSVVLRDLRFNGSDVLNQESGKYLSVVVESTDDVQPAIQDVVAFAPHVILSLAGQIFTEGMLRTLEGSLGTDGTYFVLSPINAGALELSVKPFLQSTLEGVDPNVNKRYFGVNVAGAEDKNLYNEYLTNLRSLFQGAREGTENFYDAFYFLAYSLHAGNPLGTVAGIDLANGMKQLVTGSAQASYSVGSANVSTIFQVLNVSGARIRLMGTMGAPDFDVERGIRLNRAGIFCFARQFLGSGSSPTLVEKNDVLRIGTDGELRFSSEYDTNNAPCLDNTAD